MSRGEIFALADNDTSSRLLRMISLCFSVSHNEPRSSETINMDLFIDFFLSF